MTSVERFLINLDTWPAGAFLRIGLGLCILPVFRLLSGGDDRIVVALTMFLALLLALRLVPAVCRRVLPFSREAKDLWFKRRNLGKRYDSYQWQKLFWMGLGMLPYALISGGLGRGEIVLLAICTIGGGAGLLLWRRTGQLSVGAATAKATKLPPAAVASTPP
ncbi:MULTISPECIES: hypothetical protein [Bradyrhizobium]|uniref:Uncharacterized protein n=1 Tax=Bradyrhizobium brasilense TaxID=1419277 RepID=A0A1G6QS97_9BRAD|nr:hypothetical protein [Bradyrhizobium brasilense]MCC8970520.1 hypothetical protein [Bradyrhizobium brasilense]SDC95161.1 hypothetical protein SAMN05216337_100692 [Bradyrhizobium brasilense]